LVLVIKEEYFAFKAVKFELVLQGGKRSVELIFM